MKTLSGGQKSRVVIAELAMKNPHILLLDEPTNHLDMESIEALADGLSVYNGGIIIISHDTRLLDKICNKIWICNNGSLTVYDGNFMKYRDELVNEYETQLELDELKRVEIEKETISKRKIK